MDGFYVTGNLTTKSNGLKELKQPMTPITVRAGWSSLVQVHDLALSQKQWCTRFKLVDPRECTTK